MPAKRKRKTRQKAKESNVRDPKKEALFREMKLSALNTKRYRHFWREMLMRIKLPDIGRNVEIAWQTIERTFDLKDYSISILLDSLQEVEDQRRRVNRAQVEMFDRFLRMHETRLKTVDATFHQNIEQTLTKKTREFKSIDYSRNMAESILHKITWRVNHRDEHASNIAKSIAFGKIDTFVDDGRNARRVITAQFQKELEALWNNLQNVFLDYRKSTANRRKAYETIRSKDELDQREVTRQWQRTAVLLDDIAMFREKIRCYKTQVSMKLKEIVLQSDVFHNTYQERKKCFVHDCEQDKHRVLVMSKEYNRTVKQLKDLIDKVEHILRYVQICRKYETQDEKILLPISNFTTYPNQPTTAEAKCLPIELAVQDYEISMNFWHRIGLAQIITSELRIERNRLLIQTNNLRKSITRYLTSKVHSISTSTC